MGSNLDSHREQLIRVLTRLQEVNARINIQKCEFFKTDLTYLGHRIDAEGLHPSSKNVDAILQAPAPTNVSELRSFLGLLSYYGKFLPNLSTLLAPVHNLLRKDVNGIGQLFVKMLL